MNRNCHRLARIALCAIACCVGAAVQALDPHAAERQRIDAERATAAAHYDERLRACAGRFAVTACVDEAKRERRETLSRLKHEQSRLDDAERRRRAQERTEALRQRAAAATQGGGDGAVRAGTRRVASEPHAPRASDGGSRSPTRPAPRASVPAPPSRPVANTDAAGRRESQEERSRATFDAAHRAAEAHRLEVEQRNAKRELGHKPAAPLPVPGAASSP